MKLIRASFENFRLLKDVDIEFSTDPRRNVTVFSALRTESGKTTMLTALQWGILGCLVCRRGRGYRLHPN